MATTRITLEVIWDESNESHPTRWDWSSLLDTDPDNVSVFDSEDV